MIRQRYGFIVGTILLGIVLHSCCDDSPRYFDLPAESGRYYENNDTIVFYCEATDEYETYILCDQSLGYYDEEIYDGNCGWWEYFESKLFYFYRDSCDSNYELKIFYEQRTDRWDYSIRMGGSPEWNADWVVWGEEPTRNQQILGYEYENVTYSDFYTDFSVKSAVFSTEYGMVQYTVDDKTFSLLRK